MPLIITGGDNDVDCGSHHYGHNHVYHQLSLMDRRTIEHVRKHTTGLSFYPSPDKEAQSQSQLKADLAHLYVRHKTPDNPVVAFKGGSLLQDLGIPTWIWKTCSAPNLTT